MRWRFLDLSLSPRRECLLQSFQRVTIEPRPLDWPFVVQLGGRDRSSDKGIKWSRGP